MNTHSASSASPAGMASILAAGATASAAEPDAVMSVINQISSKDESVRGAAWQKAGTLGAPAIKPLAELLTHEDFEVGRAASRALWKIVRQAGRPGADQERQAVVNELLPLLKHSAEGVRRDGLWMISEIASQDTVPAIAALLGDKAVREDARAALERIPGGKSLAALKQALATVPEDYKPAIAESLRARGVKVEGYPSKKHQPTRSTHIKPD